MTLFSSDLKSREASEDSNEVIINTSRATISISVISLNRTIAYYTAALTRNIQIESKRAINISQQN